MATAATPHRCETRVMLVGERWWGVACCVDRRQPGALSCCFLLLPRSSFFVCFVFYYLSSCTGLAPPPPLSVLRGRVCGAAVGIPGRRGAVGNTLAPQRSILGQLAVGREGGERARGAGEGGVGGGVQPPADRQAHAPAARPPPAAVRQQRDNGEGTDTQGRRWGGGPSPGGDARRGSRRWGQLRW